jgi:hypothetical protein
MAFTVQVRPLHVLSRLRVRERLATSSCVRHKEGSRHRRANFVIVMNVVSSPARAASYVVYDIQWVRNDSIVLQSAGALLPAAGAAEHGEDAHGLAGLTRGASLKILSTS